MPDELYNKAVARQEQLGYATFSDYIQALIRADALQSGPHIRETAAPPMPLPPTKPVNYRPSKRDIDRKAVELVKAGSKKPRRPVSPPTQTK